MKFTTFLFILCLASGSARAKYSQTEIDLLNLAYSGARNFEEAYYRQLQATPFDSETTRKLALVQAYSSTERPELVGEAIRLAREVIEVEPDGCRRDWATLVIAPLLSLNGDRRAGAEVAEKALASMDLRRFDDSQDPFIVFLAEKLHIKQIGWGQFIRNNLMKELGSYYLNRAVSEGGPDPEKAFDYYSQITAVENKELLLADPRFKKIRESSKFSRKFDPEFHGHEPVPGEGVQRNQLPRIPAKQGDERNTNSRNERGIPGGDDPPDWQALAIAFAAGSVLTAATYWLLRRMLRK